MRRGVGGHKTSFTLSSAAKRLLELLAQELGVSQSAVLELAIREKAERARIGGSGQ